MGQADIPLLLRSGSAAATLTAYGVNLQCMLWLDAKWPPRAFTVSTYPSVEVCWDRNVCAFLTPNFQ